MLRLRPVPIEPDLYAPFGAVVRAGEVRSARSANHGTARAWDALAILENARGDRARGIASLFVCDPPRGEVLPLRRLERHPASTQMFVPMGVARYLVVVARGGGEPDLATLASFLVEGAQAITYAPGTWHHPMIALDRATDFVNVIFSDGTAGDCDERELPESGIEIELPPRAGR